jgi:hypothetical protein
MSDDAEQPPEFSEEAPPKSGWSFKQTIILCIVVLAAQAGFIVLLGQKKAPAIRETKDAPHFQLADESGELMSLDDPTLFALPHTNDFGASGWLGPIEVATPSFAWTEPPRWLPLDVDELGSNLRTFLNTNALAVDQPGYKPAPEFTPPTPSVTAELNPETTMQIRGELADRPLIAPPELPSITNADLVARTRVQALVNAAGDVISAISLPTTSTVILPGDTGESRDAEARALAIVRSLRFAASRSPATFGLITFNWHTVIGNSPATTPAPTPAPTAP